MKLWRRTKQQNVHVAIYIHSKLNSLNRAIYSSWMESKILVPPNISTDIKLINYLQFFSFYLFCRVSTRVQKSCCKMEDETLKESGGIAATGLHKSVVDLLVLLRFGQSVQKNCCKITGICKMEKEKSRRRVEGDVVLFVRELGVLLIGCGSLVDLGFSLG